MTNLERLSGEELIERVGKEVRQLKIESGDKRWNGMQRDLANDLAATVAELAKRYAEALKDSKAMDELAESCEYVAGDHDDACPSYRLKSAGTSFITIAFEGDPLYAQIAKRKEL